MRLVPRTSCCVALALVLGGAASAHMGLDEVRRGVADEVARRPSDPTARLQLARAHRLARDFDAALAELEAAAERGADLDVVGTARGEVFLEAGWPRMARLELDRVLARRPDAWGARFARGRASRALGDTEAAARDFGAAIAGMAAPQPEQVIEHRDAWLALGKRAEALQALDDGMARVGRVASLQLPAVDLAVELGRYDDALARLRDLERSAPPNPVWIARGGEVLDRAGRPAEARAEYAKALELLDARARARRRSGTFDDLRRRLETALAVAPATTTGGH